MEIAYWKGRTVNTETVVVHGKRIAWIDCVKFSGILFVVMNHAELNIPVISRFGSLFYVPVFFVLAGFTYHHKEEPFTLFVKRKAKRLLVPYFGYNIFLYLFFLCKDYIIPGKLTWHALIPLLGIAYSRNSLYPIDSANNTFFLTILNSPTWFLTALFLSFVLFEFCVRFSKNNYLIFWMMQALFLVVGIFLNDRIPILLPWSMENVFIFVVFIASGLALQKKLVNIKRKESIITLVIFFIGIYFLAIFNGSMNISVSEFGNFMLIGIILSIGGSFWIIATCYVLRNHIPKGVTLIGEHSMNIMCLHMFIFMFIKTTYNLWYPGLLEGETGITILAKSFMVTTTMAILTICDMVWNLRRRKLHG